jgi:NTE family protein
MQGTIADTTKAKPSKSAPTTKKTINLALQGGGSHGSFTWGVLDRLLEEEHLEFEGITATSAGAMNASVFAYGYALGGREGARVKLAEFWKRISDAAAKGPLQPSWWDKQTKNWALENSPAFLMMDIVSRLMSPYEFNPTNANPLRDVLLESVDFDVLRTTETPIKLFLSATNVRTGKVKLFNKSEISVDACLASACLPFMFHAVEIDGEAYWDGGYMGNPALFPLIYHCDCPDVVIVHINPLERPDLPKTARDILNRINEISFNSSLMREMRAISFVTSLIDSGKLNPEGMKRLLVHSISGEAELLKVGATSKLNADWEFLTHLFKTGRSYADKWLKQNWDTLNVKSSVNIHEYL